MSCTWSSIVPELCTKTTNNNKSCLVDRVPRTRTRITILLVNKNTLLSCVQISYPRNKLTRFTRYVIKRYASRSNTSVLVFSLPSYTDTEGISNTVTIYNTLENMGKRTVTNVMSWNDGIHIYTTGTSPNVSEPTIYTRWFYDTTLFPSHRFTVDVGPTLGYKSS